MDERAQALRLGFAADGVDLRLRDVHLAAVTHAGGREELDEVGAVGLELADAIAQLVRRALAALNLTERRKDARPVDGARVDRLSQGLVSGPADRLDGREAGHEGRARVVENGVG